jgi:PAS domain S-box-containing protein
MSEIFSIVVAFMIFVVGWNSKKFHSNGYFLFIGMAFLVVGVVDFLHTVSYKGMNVFAGTSSDLATQLWIIARYIYAISMLAAPLFLTKRFRMEIALPLCAGTLGFLLLCVFDWNVFPVCFVEGAGLTPFKVASEYAICVILIAAIAFLNARKEYLEPGVFRLLAASMAVTVVSELAFTLYVDVYGALNAAGHLLKIVSFYIFYKAVVVVGLQRPHELLFRSLSESEKRLRKSEKKYRDLVEGIDEGVWAIDENANTVFVNRAMAEMLGYAPEEMLGRHLFSFIDESEIEKAKSDLEKRKSGISEKHEFEFLRKDGSGINTHLTTAPVIDDAGNYRGAVAAVMDITDKKRIENDLLRAKEIAETASKSKSDFLANMSHELRTPLNAIIGFSEFMLKADSEGLTKNHIEYLERIYSAGQHLLSLINDILDLSRIEAGKMELFAENIDLPGTLEYCMTMFREKARNHRIKMTLAADEAPKIIRADLRKLKQIIINLLSNALKFTPDGGEIHVSASQNDGYVQISVRDSGIGLKPEDMERIFAPFERAGEDGNTNIEGTGLGLSMVKRLVELHGGSVCAESAPGEGSAFYFTIPIERQARGTES